MNLKYMKVSLFEISYKKKITFSRHSNLLRCTCIYIYIYIYISSRTHTHTHTHIQIDCLSVHTQLEMFVSVKASLSLTTSSRSDSKWSKHDLHIQYMIYIFSDPSINADRLVFGPVRPGSPVTLSGQALGLSLP